jgi:hypothetical protein
MARAQIGSTAPFSRAATRLIPAGTADGFNFARIKLGYGVNR